MYDYSQLTWVKAFWKRLFWQIFYVIFGNFELNGILCSKKTRAATIPRWKEHQDSQCFKKIPSYRKDKMCIYLLQDKKDSPLYIQKYNVHLWIVRYKSHPRIQKNTYIIWTSKGGLLAHQLAFLQYLNLTALKGHLNLRNAFILEVHIDASCRIKSQRPTRPFQKCVPTKKYTCKLRHFDSAKLCMQIPKWSPQLVSKQVLFLQFLNFATSRSASSTQRAKFLSANVRVLSLVRQQPWYHCWSAIPLGEPGSRSNQ